VFGTLTQFMGLRKINTHGISNANKCMLFAAMAYNLKKYLKFTKKLVKTEAKVVQRSMLELLREIGLIFSQYPSLKF